MVVVKPDNRTHPLFQGTNNTNSLNLGLTTFCSMHCPKCTINIPRIKRDGKAKHASISDLYRDSRHMKNMLKRIHLTGGEPTIHPDFPYIIDMVRIWFNAKHLTIETNGVNYKKHRTSFQIFDLVFITHYQKDTVYPGNPDNTEIIELAEKDLGTRLIREPPVKHMEAHDTIQDGLTLKDYKNPIDEKLTSIYPFCNGDVPCSKWTNPGLPAGWYNGLLYPCCVTFGIDETFGIPVTANWKEEIKKVPMGCRVCTFRGT